MSITNISIEYQNRGELRAVTSIIEWIESRVALLNHKQHTRIAMNMLSAGCIKIYSNLRLKAVLVCMQLSQYSVSILNYFCDSSVGKSDQFGMFEHIIDTISSNYSASPLVVYSTMKQSELLRSSGFCVHPKLSIRLANEDRWHDPTLHCPDGAVLAYHRGGDVLYCAIELLGQGLMKKPFIIETDQVSAEEFAQTPVSLIWNREVLCGSTQGQMTTVSDVFIEPSRYFYDGLFFIADIKHNQIKKSAEKWYAHTYESPCLSSQ